MSDDSVSRLAGLPGGMDLSLLRARTLDAGLTGAKQLGPKSDEQIQKAAKDFEGMLLQQMFQSMWRSVPENELTGGGREGQYFRDMFIEGLANDISDGQGIGIKQVIERELQKRK